MKPADTVLYEAQLEDGSYYVVQAVPETKKRTLYVVSAFIGKPEYKNEAPQSIDAADPGATPEAESVVTSKEAPQSIDINSPDATSKTDSAGASKNSISQSEPEVNGNVVEDLYYEIKGTGAAPAANTQQNTGNAAKTAASAEQMNANADKLTAIEEQVQTERERTEQAMEETAAQWGREAPKAAPKEKTEAEINLDRAMAETFGNEGNDTGSRGPELERLKAQEESLRGAAEAYAGAGDVRTAAEVEAQAMAEELSNTTKGERTYDEQLHYDSGGDKGWYGVKRHTSEDIAELRDSGMSYEQIGKGLNDIIEDHGKENSAAAKRVEMQLNDRLRTGHKDFMTGKWVQPNQAYIDTVNETEANREGREAFASLVQSAEKEHISMEDYANNESPIWRNIPYEDDAQKLAIMQEAHARMVEKGAVVSVPGDILQYTEQAYPDLRHLKKKERAPILKKAVNALKDNLRQFLVQMGNQTFEFEVNGKVLDAKLYSTGIKEVLEKVTRDKASMLYASEEIFRNAEYLYSTPDYAGDTNVQRWNYFYTPVQIGKEIVGVRIAVRDMAKQRESQIYNWGIKKDASVGGVRDDSENRKPYGASLDASNSILSEIQPNVKGTGAAEANFSGREAYNAALSEDNRQADRRLLHNEG